MNHARPELEEQLARLVAAAERLARCCSLLPPPVTIDIHVIRRSPGRRSAVAIGLRPRNGNSKPHDDQTTVELTGCLSPCLRKVKSSQIEVFRDWAIRNRNHRLAMTYLPLLGWILAARPDPRFDRLIEQFAARERRRQQRELRSRAIQIIEADQPLIVAGTGSCTRRA